MKILENYSPDLMLEFCQEAEAMGKCVTRCGVDACAKCSGVSCSSSHQNVVRFYGICKADSGPMASMKGMVLDLARCDLSTRGVCLGAKTPSEMLMAFYSCVAGEYVHSEELTCLDRISVMVRALPQG